MSEHSYYSLSSPVYVTQRREDGMLDLKGEIFGTCFAVTPEVFLTAGHVVESVANAPHGQPTIGLFDGAGFRQWGAPIEDTEVLPCDLGLLRAGKAPEPIANHVLPLVWSEEPLGWCDDVETYGYAFGIHRGAKATVVLRAFKGQVVADPVDFVRGSDSFHVYELSFQAPVGLSGAPLFTRNQKQQLHVHGVIIGNSSSSMLVFRAQEQLVEPAGVVITERHESLSMGIAVHGSVILATGSRILDSTIGEVLRAAGKMAAS